MNRSFLTPLSGIAVASMALARRMGKMQDLIKTLGQQRVARDVPLAPFTTFRIGGPADLLYEARSADELAASVAAARTTQTPYFLLGLGANVLVGDGGFRGLVIRNAATGYAVDRLHGLVTAESGCVMYPELIESAVASGLSGLEHYVGIPSTVGGAIWQNLHFLSPAPERARTIFIAEVVSQASLLTEEGKRRIVGVDYFKFGYDESILHTRDDIVLSVTFRLEEADPVVMRRTMAENLEWRSSRHPPLESEPSAGSIFKKIDGVGAGRLIDGCGMKGTRVGGIEITRRHANILINRGGGTAA
ncbi:MAG: UDP-N-acetylmuramate dehydrogenase, partial [Thalassolituus oleivorans]